MGRAVAAALTPAQADALSALAPLVSKGYYLAGGVAVASHLHHRVSRDIDLFTRDGDPEALAEDVAKLPGARITGRTRGTLHLDLGGVPISILRYSYPMLEEPRLVTPVPVLVAGQRDLICMKLSAVAGRGLRRDFWDLHALLNATGASLGDALDSFKSKYANEDIGHVVRALAYFGDAETEPLPTGMTEDAWHTIRGWFEERVTGL